VKHLLTRLSKRDLVLFETNQDSIVGAYPFTNRETEHRVVFDGSSVNAMCAIDALGAGAMYGQDTVVMSRCRACERAVKVETRDNGATLAKTSPPTAVVWSGLRYADNCAASSLCTVIAFFCSDEHLQEWRAANYPDTRGHRLSIAEAHEVGMAIFRPMLAPASR
jgi:mercuric reductase